MDMPKIERCRVTECCYNSDEMCHALAITVGGGGDRPACDTYCDLGTKGGNQSVIGTVGACKVSDCRYNANLECTASGIMVGRAQDEADCLTFESVKAAAL
jgi:hypothetical protein